MDMKYNNQSYVSSLPFDWLIIVFHVDWFPYTSSLPFDWLIIVFQVDWFPYVSSDLKYNNQLTEW
jgi:hypothetical protein